MAKYECEDRYFAPEKAKTVEGIVMTAGRKTHLGSFFDDFLEEEGIKSEVEAVALKRVIAWQSTQAMERRHLRKSKPKL
ncbi:MAG: hypothetical protein H6973_19200 [Gammaproteobacteria bacterium]|nr:hypothetical protein [Gammaproteobacteria bacterium]